MRKKKKATGVKFRKTVRDIHFLHLFVWGKALPMCGLRTTEEAREVTCPECAKVLHRTMRGINRKLGKHRGRGR